MRIIVSPLTRCVRPGGQPYYRDVSFIRLHLDNLVSHAGKHDIVFPMDREYFGLCDDYGGRVTPLDVAQYSRRAASFAPLFTNLSTNPPEYERASMLRHFVIGDVVRDTGPEDFVVVESDVLLYSDLDSIISAYGCHHRDAVVCATAGGRSHNVGLAYCSVEWMNAFTSFISRCYSTQYIVDYMKRLFISMLEDGRDGGICDMTILTWFINRQWKLDHKFSVDVFTRGIGGAYGNGMFYRDSIRTFDGELTAPAGPRGFMSVHFVGANKAKMCTGGWQ